MLSFYYDMSQKKNYCFDNRDEEFIFNKTFAKKVVKKCGWDIIKKEGTRASKQHHSQMTLILKPNHGSTKK